MQNAVRKNLTRQFPDLRGMEYIHELDKARLGVVYTRVSARSSFLWIIFVLIELPGLQ